jgi:2-aminoethylphosphonate-pyruvate transaminase
MNSSSNNEKICLLNPGPVTLSDRVRKALLGPDLCHREPEFAALQAEVRSRLERVYGDSADAYTAVLFTGSGTAAVEAMVGSLLPRAGKALVVENGVYGERITSMLQAQGKSYDTVRSPWTAGIDLERVVQKLAEDRRITHVIAVHHETTTGRLNDVTALGELCRARDVALLLDGVSSFAGERLNFANWNLEGIASTANKCLHGVPGICFVLVRRSALEERRSGACSIYLDVFRNHQEQCKGYPLFTPAVQSMYALREALHELEDLGGLHQRHEHYRQLSRLLRDGVHRRGVELLLPEERCYSSVLTSFRLPARVKFNDLYLRCKEAGYVIYPGQQALQESIFRIAVMGDLTRGDMEGFLDAFDKAIGH